MGRRKIDYDCKYCGQSTEIMEKPVYVDSYKGWFCDLECWKLRETEDAGKTKDKL